MEPLALALRNLLNSPNHSAYLSATEAAREALATHEASEGSWQAFRDPGDQSSLIVDGNEVIARVNGGPENAAYIILCVNNAPKMELALREIRKLQAYAMTDERGMRGDNGEELEAIIAKALGER